MWEFFLNFRDDLAKAIPKLRLFARSVEHDHARADDLVSRTITKLLEKEHDLPDKLEVVPYAITVIKNLVKDDAKSAFGKHDSLDQKFEDDGFEPENRTDETPESSLLLDEIVIVLKKMSADCQAVLSRLAIGLSYEEIGIDLNWERNTVGVRALRCRKSFAELGADLI